MLVSKIDWVTDGADVNLPTEVEVDDNLSDDEIADYLSDTYGFLIYSFSLPMDEDFFGDHVNRVEAKIS